MKSFNLLAEFALFTCLLIICSSEPSTTESSNITDSVVNGTDSVEEGTDYVVEYDLKAEESEEIGSIEHLNRLINLGEDKKQTAEQQFLEDLELMGYDSSALPVKSDKELPVRVYCKFYLLDIRKIEDEKMVLGVTTEKYMVKFFFHQSWNDSRLGFRSRKEGSITIYEPEEIWTPELYFSQELVGPLTSNIDPKSYIRIDPDGEVDYSMRLGFELKCPMNFFKYPHDKQKCVFTIESYAMTRDHIRLIWDDNDSYQTFDVSNGFDTLYFQMNGSKELVKIYDEYTHLQIELTFKRNVGFYVVKLYIPFTILVIVAWLTHFISIAKFVPRLCLLLVVMYLTVCLATEMNSYVPRSSYAKGSDIWAAFCEALVFFSFMEFIVVHILLKNEQKIFRKSDLEELKSLEEVREEGNDETAKPEGTPKDALKKLSMSLQGNAVCATAQIDRVVRFLYPILFFIFNFAYLMIYSFEY